MDSPLLKPVPVGRPSLFDVPRCSDLDILDADLAVVGVPFSVPYDLYRSTLCSTAPQTIREQSMRFAPRYLTHYDFDFGGDLLAGRRVEIVDCGDVATTSGAIQENPGRITAVIRKILERKAVPIVLGGEHSIPIPVMRAYEGHGPIFMCVETYRLVGHYVGDPQVYRDKAEVPELRETQDPIEKLRAKLKLTDEQFEELDREVHEVVDAAVEFAKAGTDPKPEDALKNVYA